MPEYEAMKAALELGRRADAEFARTHSARKMTLKDYEDAIHRLLAEAVASGLEPSDLIESGTAIIENTFLDDPESA